MEEIRIRDLENLAFGVTKSSERNLKYLKLNKDDKTAKKAFNLFMLAYPSLNIDYELPEELSFNDAIVLLFFCLVANDISKLPLFSKVKFKADGKTEVYRSTEEERILSNDYENNFGVFIDQLKDSNNITDYVNGLASSFSLNIQPDKFHPETNNEASSVFKNLNNYLKGSLDGESVRENILTSFSKMFEKLEAPEISKSHYNELIYSNEKLRKEIFNFSDENDDFFEELQDTIAQTMEQFGYNFNDINQVVDLFRLDYENKVNKLMDNFIKNEQKLKENMKKSCSNIETIESYLR